MDPTNQTSNEETLTKTDSEATSPTSREEEKYDYDMNNPRDVLVKFLCEAVASKQLTLDQVVSVVQATGATLSSETIEELKKPDMRIKKLRESLMEAIVDGSKAKEVEQKMAEFGINQKETQIAIETHIIESKTLKKTVQPSNAAKYQQLLSKFPDKSKIQQLVEKSVADETHKDGYQALKSSLNNNLQALLEEITLEKDSKFIDTEKLTDAIMTQETAQLSVQDLRNELIGKLEEFFEKKKIEIDPNAMISELRKKLHQTQVEKESLQQQYDKLSADYKELEDSVANKNKEFDKVATQEKTSEVIVEELKKIIQDRDNAIQELTDRAKKNEDHNAKIQADYKLSQDELKQVREDLEKKIVEKDELFNDYLKADDDRDRLGKELTVAQDEIKILKNKFDEIEGNNTLQNELIHLNIEDEPGIFKARLKEIIDSMRISQQFTQQQKELEEVKKQLDESVKTVKDLQTDIERDEAIKKELQESNANLQKEIETLQQQVNIFEERVKAFEKDTETECAGCKDKQIQIDDLKSENQKKDVELGEKTEQYKVLAEEKQILQEQNSKKIKELEENIDQITNEQQKIQEELNAKITELEKKNLNSTLENDKQENQSSPQKQQVGDDYEIKIRKLEETINNLETEKQTQIERIEKLEKEAKEKQEMIDNLQEQLSKRAQDSALEEQNKKIVSEDPKIAELTIKFENAQKEVEKLQQEATRAQTELAQVKEELKQVKADRSNTKAELEKLNENTTQLQTGTKPLIDELNVMKEELEKVREERDKASRELNGIYQLMDGPPKESDSKETQTDFDEEEKKLGKIAKGERAVVVEDVFVERELQPDGIAKYKIGTRTTVPGLSDTLRQSATGNGSVSKITYVMNKNEDDDTKIKLLKHKLLQLGEAKLFYNLMYWLNDEANFAILCAKLSLSKKDPEYRNLENVLLEIQREDVILKDRFKVCETLKKKDTENFLLMQYDLLSDLVIFCSRTHQALDAFKKSWIKAIENTVFVKQEKLLQSSDFVRILRKKDE